MPVLITHTCSHQSTRPQFWTDGIEPPKWATQWAEKIGEASQSAADKYVATGDKIGDTVTEWGHKAWNKTKELGHRAREESERHAGQASTQTGGAFVRVGQWLQGKGQAGDPWRQKPATASGAEPVTKPGKSWEDP